MGHGQPSRRNPPVMGNRRVTEGAALITDHAGYPSPGVVGGSGPQRQVPHQPATSSIPGPSPFWRYGNSSIHTPRTEDGETAYYSGSASLYPPPSAAPRHPYPSAIEICGLGNGSDGQRELHDSATQISRSVAGFNEGIPFSVIPPQRVDRYPYDHTHGRHHRSPYERQALGNPESSYIPHSNWGGSADSHNVPPHFNTQTSTPGRRRHEDQLLVTPERSTPVSHLLHSNGPGVDSYVTTDYPTFVLGGPPGATWRDHINPHTRAIFYHSRPQSDRTPTSSGRGGGRTVEPECPRPSDPHRLGDDGVGDVEHPVVVPPNPRSDGMFSQSSRVQGSGRGGKAKLTAGQDAVVPVRKRVPGYFQASAVQPPTASAATPDPTHLIMVPQSWYKCATKQGGWVKMLPIEFWGIKLTDAANKAYPGLRGCDDKVLNYKGVGSSIQCRLNFSRKDIGRLKILATNNKSAREPITKKKLAFEVAKLVSRHVGAIRAEPDCTNITFENLVLVRLVHVSKASWQPVLWYEAAGPYLGPL